jgi:signal peptidase I
LSWIGAAVIVVLLLLKVLVFDVATVGHNGMAPTLVRGERILINKRGKPVPGTIAVCKHPTEEGWVVGRVVATEGSIIESFGDVLRLDGQPAQFDERGSTEFYNDDNGLTRLVIWGTERAGTGKYEIFFGENRQHLVRKTTVDPGKVYLLGDYRGYMGQDSRAYGQVDAATCRGTIVFRLSPAQALPSEISHRYLEPVR